MIMNNKFIVRGIEKLDVDTAVISSEQMMDEISKEILDARHRSTLYT
jgi:hypothetical protein